MECLKTDTYLTLSNKAATKCSIPYQDGYEPLLFKVNGTFIVDEDITIKGKIKPWTLGRYLQLTKKAPYNLKIGVAIEEIEQDEESWLVKAFFVCVHSYAGHVHMFFVIG